MANIITESLKKLRARQKRYYENHKEERKEKMRQYEAKNKEKRKEYKKNNYLSHREETKERSKEISRNWYLLHKEKTHDKVRKRRADKRNIVGKHFTNKEFKELCNTYGNKCLCCGRTDVRLSADHVIPTVLGLPYSDEITNIQPLCLYCNQSKGTKTTDYRGKS